MYHWLQEPSRAHLSHLLQWSCTYQLLRGMGSLDILAINRYSLQLTSKRLLYKMPYLNGKSSSSSKSNE